MRPFLIIGVVLIALTGCTISSNTTDTVPPSADTMLVALDTFYVTPEPEEPEDSLFMYYEKEDCFGQCPVYQVWVYQSGYARFYGDNYVDPLGHHAAWCSSKDLEKITSVAQEVEFWQLDERYDKPGSPNIPATILELNIYPPDTSNLRNRVFARIEAPYAMGVMAQTVESVIFDQDWKFLPKEDR